MGIDPNNPVVKLCAAGISAEFAGRRDEAAKLYKEAWDGKTTDFDACIAAHYVARLQPTPRDALHWNEEALRFAEQANAEELRSFFPSLYLNLGKAHEDLGNFADAKNFYLLAEGEVGVLPNDAYAETVKRGIRGGLERVARAERSQAHHA
jgi:tetratricopeptide (TPR) repeat protein